MSFQPNEHTADGEVGSVFDSGLANVVAHAEEIRKYYGMKCTKNTPGDLSTLMKTKGRVSSQHPQTTLVKWHPFYKLQHMN